MEGTMGEDIDISAARVGRNQALYREVNERVREMNEAFDALLPVSRSLAQAAAIESAFRDANEQIQAKADELGFGGQATPYLCECEDAGCTEVIGLTRAAYEEVRAHPRRFVMVSGHQEPDSR